MKTIILICVLVLWNFAHALTCPDGSNSGGKGCVEKNSASNITAFGICKRINNGTSSLFFIPVRTNEEWTRFLERVPNGVTLANCDCAASLVNWNTGAACTGSVILGVVDEVRTVPANSPMLGSAQFKCVDGGWQLQGGGTCAYPPSNCSTATVNWNIGGRSCSATASGINHNDIVTLTDATAPATGSQQFRCDNGSFVTQGTGSCVEKCEANPSQTWSQGGYTCTASLAEANNGGVQNIIDNDGSDKGTATWTCTNGSWVPSNVVCNNAMVASCLNVGGSYEAPNKCRFSGGSLDSGKVISHSGYPIMGDSYTFGGTVAGLEGSWAQRYPTSMMFVSGKLNANYFCKKVISNSYVTSYAQAPANSSQNSRFTYKLVGDSNGIGWNGGNNPHYAYADQAGGLAISWSYPANQDLSSITCCLDSSCPRLISGSFVNNSTCSTAHPWGYGAVFNTDAYSADTSSCTINMPTVSSIRNTYYAAHNNDPNYYQQNFMWGLGNTAGFWDAPMVQDVKRAADQSCKQKFGLPAYAERWAVDWIGEDEAYYAVYIPSYGKFTFDYTGNAGHKNLVTGIVCRSEYSEDDCQGGWGACSHTCGTGTQTYTITKNATGGGLACPSATGDTRSCNTQACPEAINYPQTGCASGAATYGPGQITSHYCNNQPDGNYSQSTSMGMCGGSIYESWTCVNRKVTAAEVSCGCD